MFVGARTYKLVLTDEGLYVLQLGKAMGARNKRNFLADKILDRLEEKRQNAHAEKEREMMTRELSEFVDNKKNFLLKKADMKSIKFANLPVTPKLSIKSDALNITLHFQQTDRDKVQSIANFFA